MTIKRRYLPPTVLAMAAAASIATAPAALAEQSCTYTSTNSSTVCQTPGNAQIVTSPPRVQINTQFPYFGGGLILFDHGGHRQETGCANHFELFQLREDVDASQVMVVRRTGTTIATSKDAASGEDALQIRTTSRVGFGFANPAGVIRLYDAA